MSFRPLTGFMVLNQIVPGVLRNTGKGFRPLTGFMVLNLYVCKTEEEFKELWFPSPYGVYGS